MRQKMPSKYLVNNRKKKAMKIEGTPTSTMSVRTNPSIAASQFQKKLTSFEDHSKNEQWYSSNRDSKESSEPACRRKYKNRNTIIADEQVSIIFFLVRWELESLILFKYRLNFRSPSTCINICMVPRPHTNFKIFPKA
jgi:hypothetical protein